MAAAAMQGMSAAIVLTAIDKISEMINQADAAMQRNLDKEITRRAAQPAHAP